MPKATRPEGYWDEKRQEYVKKIKAPDGHWVKVYGKTIAELRQNRKDREDAFARELAGELIRKNPELIIITDEIGCGIVPMDAGERIYRECAGRVCTELAAFSEKVYRVSCGIGVLIKG